MHRGRGKFTAGLGFAVCLWGSILQAQTGTATISGMVQDESSAAVPGANVTVTNVDTGISRSLVTDGAGRYQAPGLIPGHYEVQAQASGFQTAIRRGIQLTVGSEPAINLLLPVGQVTQSTVVTADAPLVDTVTSGLSGLVEDKTVRDLPLNGRSFDQLISLQSSAPQVRIKTAGVIHGTAGYYSVAGARGISNRYTLDGTEMVGGGGTTSMPGGTLGTNMGVEAVQEFQVLTSNYSAAYGKKAGGVINVATRSGTNAIHGSAYEFLRNDNFDARNFFDQGAQPPEFKRNQFGGSLGGPLRRDSTFFFGNYEGLRERLGETNIATVMDDTARRGLLPDRQNPGQFIPVGVAPHVQPFLVLFPRVNGRLFGDGTGEYHSAASRVSRQDFFLIRVDRKLSDQDFIFGRYNFSDSQLTNPGATFDVDIDVAREQVATMEWKRAGAALVNSLRFGFSRGASFIDSQMTIDIPPSLLFLDGASTIGPLAFGATGFEAAAITAGGTGPSAERLFVINLFQVANQVYHQRGSHALQYGVELHRIQNNNEYSTNKRGAFEFDSLRSFLEGAPYRFRAPDPTGSGDAHKSYRRWYGGTYIQDDYKVRPNLTLNLGLRYEVTTVPTEASGNRISNWHFQKELVNGFQVLETNPRLGSPFWSQDWLTFAPRVGFAWGPRGNGVMAIRGGLGVYYDQIDGEFRVFTQNNVPFFGLLDFANPAFPQGLTGSAPGQAPVPAPEGLDFGLNVPTRLTWNLNIQRQLQANLAVTAAYVGSQTYHLTRRSDANQAIPEIQAGGVKFFRSGLPRRNPRLGGSRFVVGDANSSYHALQLDLNQRLARGLRYKLSYTFSKNMDDASSTNSGQALGGIDNAQDVENLRADRGFSNYDMRNNFSMNLTYDLPGAGAAGVARYLLGGWQLGTILSISDGTPFTVITGFSRSRNRARTPSDRPNLRAGASNNPVLGGPDLYFDPSAFELPPAGFYGNLGRNTLIGPGLVSMDFSVSKMFRISEGKNLHFRAEIFDLLNRANFGLPNQTLFDPDGQRIGFAGRITSTVTTSRQIQFALKILF